MVIDKDFFRPAMTLVCQQLHYNHYITTCRQYHHNPCPKQEVRTQQNSYRRGKYAEDNARHQCTHDIVAFQKGCRTCAVGSEIFFHESKLNVFEMMFSIQTPGQPMNEFMRHNQDNEQHDKQKASFGVGS